MSKESYCTITLKVKADEKKINTDEMALSDKMAELAFDLEEKMRQYTQEHTEFDIEVVLE